MNVEIRSFYCPLSSLFHLTRAIMILVKSQAGSNHMPIAHLLLSLLTLPPDKGNNDSGRVRQEVIIDPPHTVPSYSST